MVRMMAAPGQPVVEVDGAALGEFYKRYPTAQQVAINGVPMSEPAYTESEFGPRGTTGGPLPGGGYPEAQYPLVKAGVSVAAALPWVVGGALAAWDLFGSGIGGDPGGGVVTTPSSNGAVSGAAAAAPIPLVGPGVPEPPGSIVKRRWETRVYDNELGYVKMNFYSLTDGRIAMYHNYKKYWKVWRPKKNVVISSNPRLKDLKKLDRVYKRTQKMVRKYAPKDTRRSIQAPSDYLSKVEVKKLRAMT